MAVSVDPLVVGRVIGDVLDMFVPTVTMSVYYGSKHVTNGCDIKPSTTINPPKVSINGHSDELYTLVMTDPDAPSPSEPSMREWVHWSASAFMGFVFVFFGILLLGSFYKCSRSFCKPSSTCLLPCFRIVSDIPGGTNPTRGKEILVYMGPRPPVGIHRYVLVLFQQKGPLGPVQQPASRANFSTRLFAQHLNLGLPVATVYFNAQKEPVSRRR